MLGSTILLALREIRRHLMRSFLTTLGIVIGVAAVITLVTLGNGVTASIQQQIASLGSNIFYVMPVRRDRGTPRPFKSADVEAAKTQIAGITNAAGVTNASTTAFNNGQNWQTSVNGADSAFLRAQSIEVIEGREFTPAEETAGKSVCLLGQKVRKAIFVPGTPILGTELRLGTITCTVIGLLKERGQTGAGGQDADNVVMLPLKTVQRRFTGTDSIQYFVVQYDKAYASSGMQASLVDLLRQRRLLQPEQPSDFNVIDTAQINETMATAMAALTAMVAAIAAISLIVGGVGIMNIMLVSVTERTREIGIRLAVGAMAREVRMQFLTEAVVLCCFGGVIGMLLGLGASIGLAALAGVPFVFSPAINAVSFVVSALIGIVFGYFPAQRAAKLDPIVALRHE